MGHAFSNTHRHTHKGGFAFIHLINLYLCYFYYTALLWGGFSTLSLSVSLILMLDSQCLEKNVYYC